MTAPIVFTFIGVDKPGLVEKLTQVVSNHDGNWLESRMSQLAGRFAGIAQVQVPKAKILLLHKALQDLSSDELTIIIQAGESIGEDTSIKHITLSLIGNDRPGILMELSQALASRNINVAQLSTRVTSAPMTADSLFEATADIHVPLSQDIAELSDSLDEIADDLSVDITLDS